MGVSPGINDIRGNVYHAEIAQLWLDIIITPQLTLKCVIKL